MGLLRLSSTSLGFTGLNKGQNLREISSSGPMEIRVLRWLQDHDYEFLIAGWIFPHKVMFLKSGEESSLE